MKKQILSMLIPALSSPACHARGYWPIGSKDNSGADLALGPSGYKKFLANDFDLVDSDPKGSVMKVTVNGRELNTFSFPAAELLRGGSLDLEMSDKPNYNWGIGQ